MTAPRDPIYPHWRIEPRVFGVEDVRRVWIRDDGVETEDPAEIELIELDNPLETDEPAAKWLWKQLGKGRKYALPHQAFVDLYVIWCEQTPHKTQRRFVADVGEDDRHLVRGILQGRESHAEYMTWERLMDWVVCVSAALIALGKDPVELRLDPTKPAVARVMLWSGQASALDYWDRHLKANPNILRTAQAREMLCRQFDSLDDMVTRYLSETFAGGRLRKPVEVTAATFADLAMMLWLASGLTLEAWHDRLELEFDMEPVFRGDEEDLTEEEFDELNLTSYRKMEGIRAKHLGEDRWRIRPGVPRRDPVIYFVAPGVYSE